ncbi:TPA: hypothetical protein DEP34_03235 [Candidatus Uhrbacteria bacterium]|uniref:Uncharacterized protein n=2 Tax=Candidatus Uhriibacteriota TaxID=1752732 RepID=A0A0G1Q8M5_9BACT|nr:MAG: hypothetical protein UX45_C0001G0087 [Candidatus Uhrbacteria bacterium GW2011_GWF2_46_218]KKU41349.1 MAG: hypothetical protein UX57_C0004G0053 [Candidatus Uhrbacteria bacterium GW2011_GWE2_46_68]HBK33782.1 hypothetical protein [Candidatus Uhrbacteria bacterium]HCB19377.1 hypothetical protein [Candidatus Uhrbacteria bacterium]
MEPIDHLYKSRQYIVLKINELLRASDDSLISYEIDLFSEIKGAPDPENQYLTLRKLQVLGALVYQEPPEGEVEKLGKKVFYWKVDIEKLKLAKFVFRQEKVRKNIEIEYQKVDKTLLVRQIETAQKQIISASSDALVLEEIAKMVDLVLKTKELRDIIESKVDTEMVKDQKEINALLPKAEQEVRSCAKKIAHTLDDKKVSGTLLENIKGWNAFRLKGMASSEGLWPIMEHNALCSIISAMNETQEFAEFAKPYIEYWPNTTDIKEYKISPNVIRLQHIRDELLNIRTSRSWGQWHELLQIHECLFQREEIISEFEDLGESMRSLDASWVASLLRKILNSKNSLNELTSGQFSREKYQNYANCILRLLILELSTKKSTDLPEIITDLEIIKDGQIQINESLTRPYLVRKRVAFKTLQFLWDYRSEIRYGTEMNKEYQPLSTEWISGQLKISKDTMRQRLNRLRDALRCEKLKLPISLEEEKEELFIKVELQ